jgi:hypothetical protein
LEGNIGEKDGKPLCCPRGCDQCGKDNCVVANSLAKERKGLPWVEKNCCPTSLKELGCNKKGAETPCKCKEQGKCRREAPKYGLTFVATGCCNYSPSTAAMDYWETQLTSTAVFTDMHATCEAVKGGTASGLQKSTCGCSDTLPSKCQLQSAFTNEPPPPDAPPAVDMPAGARGLNMDCSKWRDQVNEGKSKQLQSMIRCMQQDCAQSLAAITCDYVTPETGGTANAGLCYTSPGQIFCKENPTSPDCKRVAKWMPVKNIPFRGDSTKGGDGVTDEGTFSCVCAKKCSYWKSAKALRCAEGWEMLGNPYTSQFDSANLKQSQGENGIVRDNNKKEECACVCGNAADGKWYTVA